jgi:hypothetical protein
MQKLAAGAIVECPLLALSGQSNHTGVCPLLDQQRTKGGAGAERLGR